LYFEKANGEWGRLMLSSTILKLTDPYEYQAAMGRAEEQKSIITAPGSYRSELTLVDLHCLGLQLGRIALPRIVQAAPHEDLCNFAFLAADNQSSVTFNGIEQPQSSISFQSPGAQYTSITSAECYWGGISLTPETLASTSRALTGYEITVPKASPLIHTPPTLLARLDNLHRSATALAATVPDILTHPEVAKAIEQELLRALIACLTDTATIEEPNPKRQRLLQRFHQVAEANPYEPLYLPEICAAVGVTERTLHIVCKEYLGMGAHRYLRLRRMNLVRRALALADPEAKTVTMIANDYGFAELGRFAVAYRALYGESPSATLRRIPD
jgi:AraC-like DNA-binding protein